jgi:Zn-dependent protease/predicted transcriptional regulator
VSFGPARRLYGFKHKGKEMRSWSLPVGKFFGIQVYIHWTFWILIVWVFLMHAGSPQGVNQGIWGVLFILALFACVVLHEFGHALTAKRFGVVTRDITLYPIGGISSFESMPEKPAHELLISLAGPSVNVVIAIGLWIYLSSTGQVPDLSSLNAAQVANLPFLYSLFIANAMLAVFNLVPAFPMDGGRVFRALLGFTMNRATATRIAAALGQILAIGFVFLGFFYNFWLVFIGLFIYLGAGGEAAFEQTKSALAGLTVRDALMHRFTVLGPDATIGEAVDALLNSQETEFVVADAGKPIGLLTRNEIVKGLSSGGNEAAVSAFMNTEFFIVSPEAKLFEFFESSTAKGQSVALVMSGDNFEGLIDMENVQEKLMIQEALRSRNS